jgi:uncharacterized protein YkwD
MRKNIAGKQTVIFLGTLLCLWLFLSACATGGTPGSSASSLVTPIPTPTTIIQTHGFNGADLTTPTSVPTVRPTSQPNVVSPVISIQSPLQSRIAQAVFQAINQSRKANGLSALQWDPALQRSAHQHNLAMEAAQELSHQIAGEAALGDRETAQGVQWTWAGENIGYTTEMDVAGALALHQDMMNEQPPDDGHRQNILTSQGNLLGVDIVLDTRHDRIWLTEDFAQA